MKVHRTTDEMVLSIEQHKKEIWEWKQKESNWINTQNLADGYKKVIEDLSAKLVAKDNIIKKLEQEIERLVAENKK